ncbi:hypothetical protein Tsubulata_050827 [Turnera subulata]|uniref:Uncharacterized protein n=1 Tax=Turnera subulata TaxID=218843 RepID=A0A9Q0FBD5_9ROSI|nr:hypothetical protein Tsubulata_050827 [Turnera subulata]
MFVEHSFGVVMRMERMDNDDKIRRLLMMMMWGLVCPAGYSSNLLQKVLSPVVGDGTRSETHNTLGFDLLVYAPYRSLESYFYDMESDGRQKSKPTTMVGLQTSTPTCGWSVSVTSPWLARCRVSADSTMMRESWMPPDPGYIYRVTVLRGGLFLVPARSGHLVTSASKAGSLKLVREADGRHEPSVETGHRAREDEAAKEDGFGEGRILSDSSSGRL